MTDVNKTGSNAKDHHHHHKHHHRLPHKHEQTPLISDNKDLEYDPLGEVPDGNGFLGNLNAVRKHEGNNRALSTKSPKLPSAASHPEKRRALTFALLSCVMAILVSCVLWARWTTSKAAERAKQKTQNIVSSALNGNGGETSITCNQAMMGVWLETCLWHGYSDEGLTLSVLAVLPDGSFMKQQINETTTENSHSQYGSFSCQHDAVATRKQNCKCTYQDSYCFSSSAPCDNHTLIIETGSFLVNSWNFHEDFQFISLEYGVFCQNKRLRGMECRHYMIQAANTLHEEDLNNPMNEFRASTSNLCS